VPSPSEYPYFAAARVDLLFKQNLDIGKPIPMIPLLVVGGPFSNLLGLQTYLESDNVISNSIERHPDGSIYIAYTPRTSPYWYDRLSMARGISPIMAK